jgi:predicted anti-sigma-YlaC factor YlaD
MNCKLIEKKIIFYLENELDAKQSSMVEAHLNECLACKYLYTQIEASLNIIKSDKLTETNPFFSTRVIEKVKNQTKTNPILDWIPKKQLVFQFSVYILLIFFALMAGSYLGSGINATDQIVTETNSDTTDYQLFADSYHYNFNRNEYAIEVETKEK